MNENGEMIVYRLGAPCGLSDIEEGNIYAAKVQGFANFGTFVYLNSRIKGLVHKSNIKTRHSEGEMIFVKEPELTKKMQHATCHELTHAFSAHLHLPMWLNEGIAMITVDRFFGHQTVRSDTLNALHQHRYGTPVGEYRDLHRMHKMAAAYHYARGYWITRFLMDTHPGLLRKVLTERHRHRAIVKRFADALGIKAGSFWRQIDARVMEHFGAKSTT